MSNGPRVHYLVDEPDLYTITVNGEEIVRITRTTNHFLECEKELDELPLYIQKAIDKLVYGDYEDEEEHGFEI